MHKYRNLHTWTPFYKYLALLLLCLIPVLLLALLYIQKPFNTYQNQLNYLKEQQSITQTKIKRKQSLLDYEQAQKALNNSNPKVRLSAKQISADTDVQNVSKKLFPILLNYSSSKEYSARKNKAKPYLAPSLLNSEDLFLSDKDDGVNYISTVGLSSSFISLNASTGTVDDKSDVVPVIVTVTYKVGFKDKRAAKVIDIYSGSFNYETNKFETLTFMNNLSQGV